MVIILTANIYLYQHFSKSYSLLSPVNIKVSCLINPFSSLKGFMLIQGPFFDRSWDCSVLTFYIQYSCFYGANENGMFENKRLYFNHSPLFIYSLFSRGQSIQSIKASF